MILYGMIDSGNCYKPRLLMAKLGIAFTMSRSVRILGYPQGRLCRQERQRHGAAAGTRRRPAARSNPTPSCSISPKARAFLPADNIRAGLAYQWLFFEQYMP